MSKKMILSGIVGAAITASVGFSAWVGADLFNANDLQEWPTEIFGIGIETISDTADFDQDGFADLLVVIENFGTKYPAVLLNQSGTGFTQVWTGLPMGNEAFGWHAGDVNGDGYPDLVKAAGISSTYVYINQLALLAACPSDLDKTGATEIGDLLFVIDRWGVCGEG